MRGLLHVRVESAYSMRPPRCSIRAIRSKTARAVGHRRVNRAATKIYRIIAQKGKITKQELIAELNLKPEVLEAEFATLRHCELIRAQKEGSIIYLTKW